MYLPHECAPGLVVQPEWRGFRPLFDREAIEKPWEIEGKRALTKSFALNSTPAKKLGQSSRKVASVVKSDVKHRLPAFTLIKNSGPDLTARATECLQWPRSGLRTRLNLPFNKL